MIKSIVEGHSEVNAVPALLRRIFPAIGAWGLEVGTAIRRKRNEFNSEEQVSRAVRLASFDARCSGIIIVFDSDDACPKHFYPLIAGWARVAAGQLPCQVVMATREYEAWFLGALESLKQMGVMDRAFCERDPESIRGAKEWLSAHMHGGYSPTAHQVSLTSRLDLQLAYQNCRSFRRLVNACRVIAGELGYETEPFPPRPQLGEEA
jgi:hypothetical protein